MTTFLLEKEPGFGETAPGLTIPGRIEKMGYKGVETTEMVLDGHAVPASSVLGGPDAGLGRGFYQMMDGIEVGRVNVAARACGISLRAFELAVAYAQQRSTFGQPIAKHQAVAFKLAEMGTKIEAAHALMVNAARLKDAGQRNDVEAGMAKLLASEYCAEVVQEAFRIHGGYGYSKEYEIERLMREAPFLLIGEGTSEIQKTIISRGLLKEYAAALRLWALSGRAPVRGRTGGPEPRTSAAGQALDRPHRPRCSGPRRSRCPPSVAMRRPSADVIPCWSQTARAPMATACAHHVGRLGGRAEHVDQVDRLGHRRPAGSSSAHPRSARAYGLTGMTRQPCRRSCRGTA